MMAFWYLVLAVFLAVTLNQSNRFVRALGTVVACLSLMMMVSSIILADFDGTFAHMPSQGDLVGRFKPLILKIRARSGRPEFCSFHGPPGGKFRGARSCHWRFSISPPRSASSRAMPLG
jgi:hypothetical protein